MTAALGAAAEYRFIRTVSVYGTAVLPLLGALEWDGDKKWYKQLMAAVRMQAAFYPHFLEPRLAPGEELTPTELQILHLHLRGQVQRRDCADHGREAAHGEDPRQPHSRQAGREAPGGSQDSRKKAVAHSG